MNRIWTNEYEAGVPTTLSYPDRVLPDLLASSAARYPHRPALRFYGGSVSYQELDAVVNRLAHGLARIGVQKGDVVGLMLPNVPQVVMGYYAGLRLGAAITAINPLYVQGEIEQQIKDSGCQVLLALDQFYPRLKDLLSQGTLKHLVLTRVQDYLPWLKRLLYPLKAGRQGPVLLSRREDGRHWLADLLAPQVHPPTVQLSPDNVALLQYTGGTTGTPKGVVLTHRNLICNTWQCRHWMPTLREGTEVFLAVLPFFHVYGLSACQNLAVSMGACMTLLPRFQVLEVLQTITRDRVTVFPGVPAMYAAINGHHGLDGYDLTSVRLCISGAGPLPPLVQERFERVTGARLVEGYGLTEASPVTHINPIQPASGKRRQGSIGVPLPDTLARIVDVESGTRELPVGETGELVIRGPQIMQGYWHRDDETRQVLKDGWLHTGDIARMDDTGYFYIQDRKKDMIKSGGENVYPREIEEVLLRHPDVKDAVVAGIPRGLRGELIKAYVVLKEGTQTSAADLLEHCRKDLAKFKVPKRIEFRPELPRTLVGKVLRRVLIEEELRKSQAHGDHPEPSGVGQE
jgi:long-chain acyl-CoA synthetase